VVHGVLGFKSLVAGTSPQKPWFVPRSVHVVERVAMGLVPHPSVSVLTVTVTVTTAPPDMHKRWSFIYRRRYTTWSTKRVVTQPDQPRESLHNLINQESRYTTDQPRESLHNLINQESRYTTWSTKRVVTQPDQPRELLHNLINQENRYTTDQPRESLHNLINQESR